MRPIYKGNYNNDYNYYNGQNNNWKNKSYKNNNGYNNSNVKYGYKTYNDFGEKDNNYQLKNNLKKERNYYNKKVGNNFYQ